MEISSNGIAMIKDFEGCFLQAYDDGTGVWTIGWGHTANVKKGDTITTCQANEYLLNDLKGASCEVQGLIDNGTIQFEVNQNMFDSLVSFDFNLGGGNLFTLVNGRDKQTVAAKMLLYVNAGGHVLQGLVNRRQKERELFLKEENIDIVGSVKMKYIVKGEKSNRVKIVQALLNQIRNTYLSVDGLFGELTEIEVKRYQGSRHLDIDGIIGEQTINSMLSDTKNILMG